MLQSVICARYIRGHGFLICMSLNEPLLQKHNKQSLWAYVEIQEKYFVERKNVRRNELASIKQSSSIMFL